ncbi:MAG: von Willebrand factor type A domain-containing protein [Paracoccaceae bacterium]
MTDDLDVLRDALRKSPRPDPAAKADAIAQAMKNFDGLQGSDTSERLNSDRPKQAGFLNGVRNMLNSLTSRQAMAATTSIVALCVGVVVTLPLLDKPLPSAPEIVLQPEPAAPKPLAQTPAESVAIGELADTVTQPAPLGEPAPAAEADAGATLMADAPAPTISPAPLARKAAPEGYAGAGAQIEFEQAPMNGLVGSSPDSAISPLENTEEFATAAANPVKVTAEEPVSTFSIDVDSASYAVIRNSLNYGQLPPTDAVRIEEMVNYFPYAYPAPDAGEAPFRSTVTVMQTPWNPGTRLVHIGLQGRLPALKDRPPLNLVFLIDTSGSMDEPNKLPLLKQSLKLLLSQLRPEDEIAMVAYAGSAGEVLSPTQAGDSAKILAALDNLAAGGATAGAEGLALAYQVAEKMGGEGQVSRILLATDGDFNVGIDDPEGLTAYIAKKRDTGTYLSVLGFGRGNLDDATMQALAQNGNGTAAYIDTLNEARKVLVDQLTGALFPIANDVKIQVEWNPATVAEYRLIGYETRALAREDFNNDRIDAGEIGAGHTVTAIYEITAPNSPALLNDPLRYGTAQPIGEAGELGFLRLRYKAPGEDISALIEIPITPDGGPASTDAQFAVAMAGFGQILSGARYLGDWGWDQAIDLALKSRGDDAFGYRIEAVNLMRMAQSLSPQ